MEKVRRRNVGIQPRFLEFEDEIDEKTDVARRTSSEISVVQVLLLLSLLSAAVYLSLYLHKCLPQPLPPTAGNSEFSEMRAVSILEELSDFGPKPSGSDACQLAARRIKEELETIKASSSSEVLFDIETQNPSGCFDIPSFDVDGFTVCYRNVSNVIARIGQKKSNNEEISVLLNCHFDSWPTSNGGSDDLISCALMLELIRIFSQHPEMLSHDLIFLFNGAEESELLAAHGFITQHPWRHSIRAFINLEASGSGGRELLFQAGPSNQWLLNSYLEGAVHPHCSVLGQEVFQSGVYPGDTDFRVFRDYGRIPGLDLAFVQNGYWWHTEFDEAKRITAGSLQRAGENVFSTLKHLLSSPYLERPAEFGDQKSVFFDFLGLFVVVYPLPLANLLNVVAIAVVLLKVIGNLIARSRDGSPFSLHLRALALYVLLLSTLFSATFVCVCLSNSLFGPMLWYKNHAFVLLQYAIPIFTTGILTLTLIKINCLQKNEDLAVALEEIYFLNIAFLLGLATFYDVASGFLLFLLLLPVFRGILSRIFPLVPLERLLLSHLLLSLPGLCMMIYTSEMLLSIFIPIMGRSSGNPEPKIAIFVNFAVIPIVMSLIPIVLRAESNGMKRLCSTLLAISLFLLVPLTISSRIGPFHYSEEYPMTKRTQFYHVNGEYYSVNGSLIRGESGIYAISHDFRGAEDIPFVGEDEGFKILNCMYGSEFCEIPFYFNTRDRIGERHIRYKTIEEKANVDGRTEIELRGESAVGQKVTFSFTVRGSPQMSVFLIPRNGYRIAGCSLSKETQTTREETAFLFLQCNGKDCGKWDFDVTLEGTSQQTERLVVGLASHYLHGANMQSAYLKGILSRLSERRETESRWAMTASAWNVDQVYKVF